MCGWRSRHSAIQPFAYGPLGRWCLRLDINQKNIQIIKMFVLALRAMEQNRREAKNTHEKYNSPAVAVSFECAFCARAALERLLRWIGFSSLSLSFSLFAFRLLFMLFIIPVLIRFRSTRISY